MKLKRAFRSARTVLSDWRWTPFFLQRRFRSHKTREAAARMAAQFRPKPAEAVDAAAHGLSSELASEGQAWLGQVLDPAQCETVRSHLMTCRVRDEYRPEIAPWLPLGTGRHPHSHVGYHDHADVVRTPHLMALANRPDLLAVAEQFLGCRPTISYMAAWWSYPTGISAQQAENFHRDVDDWRFLKLFVYLTDVDATKGPHVYVRKSAHPAQSGPIRRYTDEEIRAEHDAANIVYMTGKAGDAFFENTYGIHKGQPVSEGHRLIFQVVYSIVPLPYGPKRPVIAMSEARASSGIELDPFVNRVYVARP